MSIDQLNREIELAQLAFNEVAKERAEIQAKLERLAEVQEQANVLLARLVELVELWQEEHPDDDNEGEEWKSGGELGE